MKKIGIWAIMLLLISSCTNSYIGEEIEEIPQKEVKMTLNLKVSPMVTPEGKVVSTKGEFLDQGIYNLWVAQYASNGDFIGKRYYDKIQDVSKLDISVIPTPFGSTSSTLYFFANMGSELNISYGNESSLLNKKLASYYTVGDDGNTYPPMTAKYSGVIPRSGSTVALPIYLKRTVARIDINYKTSGLLQLLRYELHYVNKSMPCYPAKVADATNKESDNASDYYDPISVNLSASTGTVTLYISPNYHGNGTYQGSNVTYQTGRDLATYIDFVSIADFGVEKLAYRIYPGKNNYNSYNLEANVKYTYNLDMKYYAVTNDKRVHYPDRANCYILEYGTGANSKVNVPISHMNQSLLYVQADARSLNASQVQILWQSSANLITLNTDNLSKGYYTVVANSGTTDGNAVVAVKDVNGKILWTWHFWVLSSAVNPDKVGVITSGYYDIMALNIGATRVPSATDALTYTGGLLYQWGRKDPFPTSGTTLVGYTQPAAYSSPTLYNGAPTAIANDSYARKYTLASTEFTNQVEYSIRYPLLYLTGWMGSTAINATGSNEFAGTYSWGGEAHDPKTVYDPCPSGWRVPRFYIGDLSGYYLPWGSSAWSVQPSATATSTNFGTTASLGKIPMSGMRLSSGEFSNYQLRGYMWGATRTNRSTGYNYCGYNNNVITSDYLSCDSALPVRCVRERM